MHKNLVELLQKNVPTSKAQLIESADAQKFDSSILIEASSLYESMTFLKENSQFPFNVLQVITGTDFVDYLEVSYVLAHFSVNDSREVILKVRLQDRTNPSVDSVVELYPAANYQERECYDMLGVSFNNHPDHRRILCPDDWEGFPLRRDYKAATHYRDMEIYPESKMNKPEHDFIARQEMINKAQAAAAAADKSAQ